MELRTERRADLEEVRQVLSPLGVVPQRQGQGVGSALVRAGLRILDERGVPLVFVEGDPAYYRRFGFTSATSRGSAPPPHRRPADRVAGPCR